MQGHEGCGKRASCPHLVHEAWEAAQVGSTSGLQGAMWLLLLPAYSLSHSEIRLDLALDPSQSEWSVLVFAM